MSNIEVRITKDVERPGAALRHSAFGVLPFDKLMAQALSEVEGRFYGSLLALPAARMASAKRHSARHTAFAIGGAASADYPTHLL